MLIENDLTGKVNRQEPMSRDIKVGQQVIARTFEQDDNKDEELRNDWLKSNEVKKSKVLSINPDRTSKEDFNKWLEDEKKNIKPKTKVVNNKTSIGVSLDETRVFCGN